jgi:ribosomal protein S18 acetylase RimI-like enzyme
MPAVDYPSTHVRRATGDDAASIAILEARVCREGLGSCGAAGASTAPPASPDVIDRIAREIASSANRFLLLFLDSIDEPVGFSKLRAAKPNSLVLGSSPIEIERFCIDDSVSGRGLPAVLMRECLDEAVRAGFRTVWLYLPEGSERGIELCRRWDFVERGIQVVTRDEEDEARLVLERPSRRDG